MEQPPGPSVQKDVIDDFSTTLLQNNFNYKLSTRTIRKIGKARERMDCQLSCAIPKINEVPKHDLPR